MRLRSKLDFIDAIILKFNTAWLKSNLNNIITSISVLSDNNFKTKLCRKITTEFSKTMKTVFFDSKTHSTCYTNIRLKTALIPLLGKHMEKTVLYLIQKHAAEINRSTSFMWDNM